MPPNRKKTRALENESKKTEKEILRESEKKAKVVLKARAQRSLSNLIAVLPSAFTVDIPRPAWLFF